MKKWNAVQSVEFTKGNCITRNAVIDQKKRAALHKLKRNSSTVAVEFELNLANAARYVVTGLIELNRRQAMTEGNPLFDTLDFKPYEEKYGEILERLALAFAEVAADGDEVGMMFLLNSMDAIVRKSDKIFGESYKILGHA